MRGRRRPRGCIRPYCTCINYDHQPLVQELIHERDAMDRDRNSNIADRTIVRLKLSYMLDRMSWEKLEKLIGDELQYWNRS